MMSEELKPCPFCGADNPNCWASIRGAWEARCRSCLVSTPLSASEADAIAAWNRRALPDREKLLDENLIHEEPPRDGPGSAIADVLGDDEP
jgi:hypothetical protein